MKFFLSLFLSLLISFTAVAQDFTFGSHMGTKRVNDLVWVMLATVDSSAVDSMDINILQMRMDHTSNLEYRGTYPPTNLGISDSTGVDSFRVWIKTDKYPLQKKPLASFGYVALDTGYAEVNLTKFIINEADSVWIGSATISWDIIPASTIIASFHERYDTNGDSKFSFSDLVNLYEYGIKQDTSIVITCIVTPLECPPVYP